MTNIAMSSTPEFSAALDEVRDQTGRSLAELSRERPQLVVFLRHGGCTFCREALGELAAGRERITAAGTGIVLVHMQTDADAEALFSQYGLAEVLRISDPNQRLYRAFDLKRGSLLQVAGPSVWLSGLTTLLAGHLPGIPAADVFQLPGTFLVHDGKIVRAFRSETSAAKPDYCELAKSE